MDTPRIPVHIVCGREGTGNSRWIIAHLRDTPAWLGLVSHRSDDATDNIVQLNAGCLCCTGAVVLQVMLVRTLRERSASRAWIEVSQLEHAQKLQRVLRTLPYSMSLAVEPLTLLSPP
jgi:hypothetical protein